ncbi:Dimeric alpha-beta barrel [Moelleriella libera RCEF 2490]|uniref:Dimeric alpha-beta barrel n=1 Tax=Moelleriella libera RCEF 2490 TaxID=1081109 RepID=A0A166RQF5_9HYPO|nr:Dimeric alpha-beta barrel [Moelleriella libera RCEF 2490]
MSSVPRIREFLVIVPDRPGTKDKRLEVRPTHFKNLAPLIESGEWKMGGALLNSVPEADDPTTFDFLGSTLVCRAESKEQIVEQLKKDIYVSSGVWDLDKVQIYPFICAFRKP